MLNRKNILLTAVVGLYGVTALPELATAATVRKVTGGYCLYSGGWKAASKVGSSYRVMSKTAKGYSKLAKNCKALLAPSRLSFSKLPAVSDIVKGAGVASASLGALDVSGTPPTLGELQTADAADIFFVPGVVAGILGGTPTQSQCDQFYASSVDGESGGLSACRMAQRVGETMGDVLQSGTTACYMQKMVDVAAVDSSIVHVVSGSLPAGGWKALFAPSESRARIVKIIPSGGGPASVQTDSPPEIFIRIASNAENLASGKQYKVNVYFCGDGSHPGEEQQMSVSSSNILSISSKGDDHHGGFYGSTVSAKLVADGAGLSFDPDAVRSVVTNAVRAGGGFVAGMTVGAGELTVKMMSSIGSGFKGYSVAQFTGDNVPELRFLSGAFKERQEFESGTQEFQGAAEYRDTGYRAAPASSLVSEVSSVDFDADPFYNSTPTASYDPAFSCSSAVDVALTLDMDADGMAAIRDECEAKRIDGEQFCQTDALEAVQSAWIDFCAP